MSLVSTWLLFERAPYANFERPVELWKNDDFVKRARMEGMQAAMIDTSHSRKAHHDTGAIAYVKSFRLASVMVVVKTTLRIAQRVDLPLVREFGTTVEYLQQTHAEEADEKDLGADLHLELPQHESRGQREQDVSGKSQAWPVSRYID